jgi:outer membrane protein
MNEALVTNRIGTCCLLALLFPAVVSGQSAPAGDRLSLDTAIRLAIENNRALETARLQINKAESDLAATRTRRLPLFETTVQGSELLTPVDFAFPRGAFGDFPGIGPIPAADTSVSVPRQPTAYFSAQVSQPISQLFELGLRVRGAALARDIEKEHARDQQIALVNSVKRMYFSILQTESALATSKETLALYRELDRTLTVRVAQKVALRADSLDVQFKLAQEEVTQTTTANTLASQKEQLNRLLGRDVRTAFDVEEAPPISVLEVDLAAVQKRALESRPDLKEARLKLEQAEIDRRVTQADRIPEVIVAVSYSSYFNIDVLPKNLASVGVQMKWEPFDWGRRGREVASKSQTVQQARLNVRDLEDQIVIDINNRFRKLAEAKAQLQVAQLAQATAREKLRVRTNQYQIQAAMLSDVLQLRAELADVDDRHQQALVVFWTAKADFDQAIGEEVVR